MSLLSMWTKLHANQEIRRFRRKNLRLEKKLTKGRKTQEKQTEIIEKQRQNAHNALTAQKNYALSLASTKAASSAKLTDSELSIITGTKYDENSNSSIFKTDRYNDYITRKNEMTTNIETMFAQYKDNIDKHYDKKANAISEGWAQIDEQMEREKTFNEDMIKCYENLVKAGEEVGKSSSFGNK